LFLGARHGNLASAGIGILARLLRHLLGLLDRLDLPPFVGAVTGFALGVTIGEAVMTRAPKTSVAPAAALGDLDETQFDELPDRGRDRLRMQPIFDEVLVSHWKMAVVDTTMMSVLDLDTGKNLMRGAAQHLVGRTFQHLDRPRSELPCDLIALAGASHGRTPSRSRPGAT
jgi:hypothetical protein